MADTPQEIVERELREFKRYTGDGLPGEPVNAPLPVGDPQSGVHNPKKVNLRKAMLAPLEAAAQIASDAADQKSYAEEWAQSDDPISVEAGGDGSTDRSAKYWAGQAEQTTVPDGSITEPKLAESAVTEAKLADGAVTEPKLAATIKGKLIVLAADRASLAAIDASAYQAAELTEGGRSGLFLWDSSDLSAEVTADPLQGLYIAPAGDATGASGAWVRDYAGALNVCWFGAVGDGATDDSAAVQAAFNIGQEITFPSGHIFEIKGIAIDGPATEQGAGRVVNARGATLRQSIGLNGTSMFIISENTATNFLRFDAGAIVIEAGGGHVFDLRGNFNHNDIRVDLVRQKEPSKSILTSTNTGFFFNKIRGTFWALTVSHTVPAIAIFTTDNQASCNEFDIQRPDRAGSARFMRFINAFTSSYNYGNIIRLSNPEVCDGGVLELSGTMNTIIEKMHTFDNGTITGSVIKLGQSGRPCLNTKIRDYQRNGGTLGSGVKDITCTNADFVVIENVTSSASGNPALVDLNGQTNCKIIAKFNATIQNSGGSGFKEW